MKKLIKFLIAILFFSCFVNAQDFKETDKPDPRFVPIDSNAIRILDDSIFLTNKETQNLHKTNKIRFTNHYLSKKAILKYGEKARNGASIFKSINE